MNHLLLIYLIGYVVSYFMWRLFYWWYIKTWTRGYRIFALITSLLSVVSIIVVCVFFLVSRLEIILSSDYLNKPAKW
jgi:hypothetical protein